MNTKENKEKFEEIVALQKKANLPSLDHFGDFDFWIEDATQEEFDALINEQAHYANKWIKYFKENDSPFKG